MRQLKAILINFEITIFKTDRENQEFMKKNMFI